VSACVCLCLCGAQSLDVSYELRQQQHLVGLIHEVDCLPSYFITGGLVFAPLSWPLLEVRASLHLTFWDV
jgi:hypothetical protein